MASFILSGEDGHSAALVELYATLLEKQGTDAATITTLRETATQLADEARAAGKPVLTLDAILMFAATLKQDEIAQAEPTPTAASPRRAWDAPLEAGEIVCCGIAGAPAKLVSVFARDDDKIPEQMRGMANIRLPRAPGVVTVIAEQLRRASPQELLAYQDAGGR